MLSGASAPVLLREKGNGGGIRETGAAANGCELITRGGEAGRGSSDAAVGVASGNGSASGNGRGESEGGADDAKSSREAASAALVQNLMMIWAE